MITETCLDSGGTLSLGESPVPGNQNIIRALAILTQQMATIGLWVCRHDLSQEWAEFGYYRTVTTLRGAVRFRTRSARLVLLRSRELFTCFVILLDIWRKVRTGTYRSHYLCTEWTEWEGIGVGEELRKENTMCLARKEVQELVKGFWKYAKSGRLLFSFIFLNHSYPKYSKKKILHNDDIKYLVRRTDTRWL